MMRIAPQIGLLALFCLSACTPPAKTVAVHQWSREEQIQIAKEHNALPPGSILRPVLDEWQTLRAAAK